MWVSRSYAGKIHARLSILAAVVNILKIAQMRVEALVPDRTPLPGVVTLYSRHVSDLADGILAQLPRCELTHALRGSQLEVDLACDDHLP